MSRTLAGPVPVEEKQPYLGGRLAAARSAQYGREPMAGSSLPASGKASSAGLGRSGPEDRGRHPRHVCTLPRKRRNHKVAVDPNRTNATLLVFKIPRAPSRAVQGRMWAGDASRPTAFMVPGRAPVPPRPPFDIMGAVHERCRCTINRSPIDAHDSAGAGRFWIQVLDWRILHSRALAEVLQSDPT